MGVYSEVSGAQAALLWNPRHFPGPLVLTAAGKGRCSKLPAWKLHMFFPFPLKSMSSGRDPTHLQDDLVQDQAENRTRLKQEGKVKAIHKPGKFKASLSHVRLCLQKQ